MTPELKAAWIADLRANVACQGRGSLTVYATPDNGGGDQHPDAIELNCCLMRLLKVAKAAGIADLTSSPHAGALDANDMVRLGLPEDLAVSAARRNDGHVVEESGERDNGYYGPPMLFDGVADWLESESF